MSDFDIDYRVFNPIAGFDKMPDEILHMLQVGSNYKLTPEQYFVAKLKSLELASIKGKITISDLVKAWSEIHALSEFANRVEKAFLL